MIKFQKSIYSKFVSKSQQFFRQSLNVITNYVSKLIRLSGFNCKLKFNKIITIFLRHWWCNWVVEQGHRNDQKRTNQFHFKEKNFKTIFFCSNSNVFSNPTGMFSPTLLATKTLLSTLITFYSRSRLTLANGTHQIGGKKIWSYIVETK